MATDPILHGSRKQRLLHELPDIVQSLLPAVDDLAEISRQLRAGTRRSSRNRSITGNSPTRVMGNFLTADSRQVKVIVEPTNLEKAIRDRILGLTVLYLWLYSQPGLRYNLGGLTNRTSTVFTQILVLKFHRSPVLSHHWLY